MLYGECELFENKRCLCRFLRKAGFSAKDKASKKEKYFIGGNYEYIA